MKTLPSLLCLASAGVSLALLSTVPASAQLSFQWLTGLKGASDVSANGSVVAGSSGQWYEALPSVWTAGGVTVIPRIPGIDSVHSGSPVAVSADGSTVTGVYSYGTGASDFRTQAFRWNAASGTVGLGALPGKVSSLSTDISGDGSVIVGYSESVLPGGAYSGPAAFRWTAAGGMAALPTGDSGTPSFSRAVAVSTDGTVVAGSSSNGFFRWTEAEGATLLGYGNAYGMSANGDYIVGYHSFNSTQEGFLWDATHGVQSLGNLPIAHHNGGFASLVSNDGRLILGGTYTQHDVTVAYLWTPESGLRFATDVLLNDYGLAGEFADWTRIRIASMSDDGRYLVGSAFDTSGLSQAWLLDRGLNPPLLEPNALPPLPAVPEPATYGLFGVILLAGALARRVRRRTVQGRTLLA